MFSDAGRRLSAGEAVSSDDLRLGYKECREMQQQLVGQLYVAILQDEMDKLHEQIVKNNHRRRIKT